MAINIGAVTATEADELDTAQCTLETPDGIESREKD